MQNEINDKTSNINTSDTLYDLQNDFQYKVLNSENLSKSNVLDYTAALDIVAEFFDVPACVIVRNAVLTGVALGADSKDAFEKAFDCNALAAIGATAAFSQTVTKQVAQLAVQYQIASIVAPAFDDGALEVLKYHEEILLTEILTPLNQYYNMVAKSLTVTPFGLIEEKVEHKNFGADNFKIPSKTKPAQEQIEDMIFAYKIAKHLKKSGAVIAKDFKTAAIITSCSCLADAIEWGVSRAIDGTKDAVLGINEPLASTYAINAAVQGRISAIIYPNESNLVPVKVDVADKFNITLVEINIDG